MASADEASIFLIGYRGTGKTTVACDLASQLGYGWVDSDHVIEEQAGKSIAQIFTADGEGAFRDLESRVVAELSGQQRRVVSLGGGAVLRAENRSAIRGARAVVWLVASIETILERVAADVTTAARRPNLTTAGGRAEIEELLAKRTPHYRECATLIVDTECKTATEVAAEIAAKL